MEIEFDADRRERVLRLRGLDLADAAILFLGECLTNLDNCFDYGEERWTSIGMLRGQVVVCVSTEISVDRVR